MEYLAHYASFHSLVKNAQLKPGIKHLGLRGMESCPACFTVGRGPATPRQRAGASKDVTTRRIGALAAAIVVVLALAFLVAAVQFARIQNVWIDETTQLSGATLSPMRLFSWLAGGVEPSIAAIPDRAPPVSYLLDAACERTFCPAPFQFRILHLLVTFAGVLLLLTALARRYGGVATMVSATVLFLSPKLIEYSVEIRPYPVFIALTCVQIVLLADLVEEERLRPGRVLLFAGVGLLAIYTHFFALVSTMALFGGLFVVRARDWREMLAIGGTAASVLVLSAGLKPFVAGASALSQTPMAAMDANAAAQFALKLIGHPAILLSVPVALAFFAGFAVVFAVAVVRAGWRTARTGWRARGSTALGLVIALALGLGVTLAAAALPHGFDPLKMTYSVWVFPVLAWLAGTACAPARGDSPALVGRVLVPLGRGAAVVFALAALVAQGIFLAHAAWFVHGPDSAIAEAAGPGTRGVALVYRGDWSYGYFPAVWRYGGRMPQWVLMPDGTFHRLVDASIDPRPALGTSFSGTRRLVVVDITPRRYRDLRALLDGVAAKEQFPPVAAPAGFTAVARRVSPGLYWTTVTTLERGTR